MLLCVGTASNLDTPEPAALRDARSSTSRAPPRWRRSSREVPEAIANTRRIAEMTDLQLHLRRSCACPHFPVPGGPHRGELAARRSASAASRAATATVTEELQRRLDYELGVIISMGYAGYFLIVADFTRFAREQGIATTCRGSAPGSIVTYTLGITPVDPILYELPFERFLNPDRVTMPDIDVDFEDSRRDEVIDYVTRKYGQDHVAQIITFGTMLARAAIRDVGRVMGFGYGEVDRIAKAIPNQLGIKLDEALEVAPAVPRDGRERPGHRTSSSSIARQLGGRRPQRLHPRRRRGHQPRPADRAHAAPARHQLGRAHDPVRDARRGGAGPAQVRLPGPLQPDHPAPGRRPHRASSAAASASTSTTSRSTTRRPSSCSARGETTGVFQLESAGMRRYIRELRPTSVYDLAAMVALFRPGPMDNIPAYIRRKHGQEPVTYLHPLLEPYLEKTYGIFVYQEDIMAAAMALGGFTGPEADTLGYAIRKKKSSVLRAQKDKFVRQAAERGVDAAGHRRRLQGLRALRALRLQQGPRHVLRPHRLPDGLPQGQLPGRVHDQRAHGLPRQHREGRRRHRRVPAPGHRGPAARRPPQRRSHFTVEGEAIRFGLLAIKNVGEGAIESIVEAREAGGPFRSLADLCARVDLRLVNKRVLESLIKVGALRVARPSRPAARSALDDAMAYGQAQQRDRVTGQGSLFDMLGADEVGARATAARRRPRRPRASGCAGRRSSSACTSRTTRWASWRPRWAAT